MLIYASLQNGRVLVVEEIRLCAICCKMINLNRQHHNKVYFSDVKGFLYSHKECDSLQPLPQLKTP